MKVGRFGGTLHVQQISSVGPKRDVPLPRNPARSEKLKKRARSGGHWENGKEIGT